MNANETPREGQTGPTNGTHTTYPTFEAITKEYAPSENLKQASPSSTTLHNNTNMKNKTEPAPISTKEFNALMKQLAELLADAVKKFREAGEIIVRLVDSDRFSLRYIHQKCPALSIAKLKLLERIGRNDFHPVLMTPGNPGETMLVQMAYSDQVAALDKGEQVVVVTMAPDGTFGKVLLPASALTTDQVNQVSRIIGGKRVYVSMEEQEAWLIDHRTNLATRPSRKEKPKWIIKDNCAVVTAKNTPLTAQDLTAALAAVLNPPPALDI